MEKTSNAYIQERLLLQPNFRLENATVLVLQIESVINNAKMLAVRDTVCSYWQ